jgi:hypothetical protein
MSSCSRSKDINEKRKQAPRKDQHTAGMGPDSEPTSMLCDYRTRIMKAAAITGDLGEWREKFQKSSKDRGCLVMNRIR